MAELINKDTLIEALQEMADILEDHGIDGLVPKWVRSVVEGVPSVNPSRFHVIDKQTGKEADPSEIALKEDWAKGLCYCDMEGFAIEEDGTLLLLDECGRHEYCDHDRFEVIWDEGDQKDDER